MFHYFLMLFVVFQLGSGNFAFSLESNWAILSDGLFAKTNPNQDLKEIVQTVNKETKLSFKRKRSRNIPKQVFKKIVESDKNTISEKVNLNKLNQNSSDQELSLLDKENQESLKKEGNFSEEQNESTEQNKTKEPASVHTLSNRETNDQHRNKKIQSDQKTAELKEESDESNHKIHTLHQKGKEKKKKQTESDDLVSLIRESLFEKERMKRDLDVYIDEKKSEDEEFLMEDESHQNFGDVEIRW